MCSQMSLWDVLSFRQTTKVFPGKRPRCLTNAIRRQAERVAGAAHMCPTVASVGTPLAKRRPHNTMARRIAPVAWRTQGASCPSWGARGRDTPHRARTRANPERNVPTPGRGCDVAVCNLFGRSFCPLLERRNALRWRFVAWIVAVCGLHSVFRRTKWG